MFENWLVIKSVKLRVREFDSYIEIWVPGTDSLEKSRKNALQDLAVSAQCWPNLKGRHAGCDRVARKFMEDKEFQALVQERLKPVRVIGYSMGSGIGECLAERLKKWVFHFKSYGGYKVCFKRNKKREYKVTRIIKGRDRIRWFCFWYFGKKTDTQPGGGEFPTRFIYDHTHYDIFEKKEK